ncbi:MAG: DUF423 domain-containing protein [Leptolyngbyaceae cyanobacterium]
MKLFLAIAAVLGGLSVTGGALASHALQGILSERALETFGTGIRYQLYHALALLIVALLLGMTEQATAWLTATGWLFVSGTFLFSGSLYVLSLSGIKAFGPVTPIGGVALIVGWFCLLISALRLP